MSDPTTASTSTEEKPASAKTTGLVSLAIFSSRIMGLIRDVLLAKFFPPYLRDCFTVAFRTPNMLRDLFAEGALSTAFVTVFSKKLKTEGDAPAWALAHKMLTLAAIFMSLISIAGVLLAPLIVRLLANGWDDEKLRYTVLLAQIMYPFILLVSLAALVMGMLNAKKVYTAPALSSTYFNIASIVLGFGLGWLFDRSMGATAMIWFSVGTLFGGLAQLASQFPALRKVGYRFKWDSAWKKDEGVRKILSLMWPAIIAGGAVQVNVLLNTIFASHVAGDKDGPVTWLGMAFRLMQLPLGVFGVAVATVTLPVISRAATDGINDKFRSALGAGNRLVIFLCLPSAIGLMMLASPIISILFERGRFTGYETLQTAEALKFYALGLVFYALIKVIQPAFTAIDRRFIPMMVATLSVLINAGLNTYFVFVLKKGHEYLAFSTALVAILNCAILYFMLSKLSQGLENRQLLQTMARLFLPLLGLAACCYIANTYVLNRDHWMQWNFLSRTATLVGCLAVAGGVYMGLATLCKVEEARQFVQIFRRKMKR
jgi:putative peptidoglycan lipid II flippase